MATTKIGQVSIIPRGAFVYGTHYERLSVVTYNGSSYIAKVENTNKPISDTSVWYLLASKGDKGDTYEVTPEDLQAIADQITSDASSAFNQNVTEKTNAFNQNATDKTSTFNSNATSKTNTFNTNATNKTTTFNNNATDKTTAFDNNASAKTTAFNDNATAKTTDFNDNAVSKTNAFNDNALNLQNQIPQGNESGTLIVINDSSNLNFKDIKLYGNTKQVQSTGKNLANTSEGAWSKGNYGSDGVATTNQYWAKSVEMISCLGGQQFTLSTQVECAGIRLYEYDALGTFIKESHALSTTSLTITTDENTRYLHWSVCYRNTTSGDYGAVSMSQDRLDSLGVMLNTGLTALPFEPYTNGRIEPSPDNPIPIEVVKGDVTIKKTRKNLLKPSVPGGVSITTLEDNVWVINGTTTSKNIYFSLTQTIKVKANVPYTFTLIPVENMESDRVQCSILGNPEAQYAQFAGDTNRYTWTFAFPKDMEIRVRLYNDRGTEGVERSFDMKFKFQIEEGDTATEYEKYEEDINIVPLGTVNLFNKEEANVQNWQINNSTHEIERVTPERSVIVQVKPNTTYTISKMQTNRFRIGEYPTTPAVGDTLNNYISDGGTVITTTTQATTNYIVIQIANIVSYDLQEVLDSLQIEEGSIAHGYSPYGLVPTELCKIGDYQDYLYKNTTDGKWYKYGAIGKYTFTGEEIWTTSKYGTNSWSIGSVITHVNDNNNTVIISNIFRGCSYADRSTAGDNIIFGSETTNIFIRNTNLPTLQDVQNATAENIIYYVLRNPVLIEITDTNLIAKLDELLDSTTFKNFTNIAVTADEQVPTLNITYYKDLETMFNTLQNAILSLGDNI